MFSNMKIGRRLLLLISVLTMIFVATGALTLVAMTDMLDKTNQLNQKTSESAEFAEMAALIRFNLLDVPRQVADGGLGWEGARNHLTYGAGRFNSGWSAHLAGIRGNAKEKEFYSDAFGLEVDLVKQGYRELAKYLQAENRDQLAVFLLKDLGNYAYPFLNAADALSALESAEAQTIYEVGEESATLYLQGTALLVLIGLIIAAILGPVIYLSITSPIKKISATVSRVAAGELDARTELKTRDELGLLGNAFDSMLEDRVSTMAKAESENKTLNDSVISLLEAVSDLSDRDLTVKVPVAEDVTGPVADAMNLMASETAKVLSEIRVIAAQVSEASNRVQAQGGRVNELAANERAIVEDTIAKLDEASKSMSQVAKLANACNETAAKASASTQVALETVAKTASGMGDIRETISETEKRIKRLGERSQEINGVVEIINNIAERTHVLALNASMQAAAAGDAGRGFAVVADEVQRLAESSRQSTSEIAGLVGNIQAETAETMATMNKTIAQVVDGTDLAQAAGGQMEETQKTTSDLASAVEQIAKRSLVQAQVSINLREMAAQVQTSTQDTSAELELQSHETANLVEYSRQLVNSVSVFKLPEA